MVHDLWDLRICVNTVDTVVVIETEQTKLNDSIQILYRMAKLGMKQQQHSMGSFIPRKPARIPAVPISKVQVVFVPSTPGGVTTAIVLPAAWRIGWWQTGLFVE